MPVVSPKAPTVGGRDKFIFNPWHYLPVLERKPGALRHGAPFQDWDLPVSIQVVRDRLLKQPQGDKAFVEVLLMATNSRRFRRRSWVGDYGNSL